MNNVGRMIDECREVGGEENREERREGERLTRKGEGRQENGNRGDQQGRM